MSTAKAKQAAQAATVKKIEQAAAANADVTKVAADSAPEKVVAEIKAQPEAKPQPDAKPQPQLLAQAAMTAQADAMKTYEEAVQAAKQNMEAFVKSGTIIGRGVQDLGKTMLGLTQEAIEESVSASRKLMGAKTLHDLMDLQANTARNAVERAMSDGGRLSDLSVKLMEEALAPINDRVQANMDLLVKGRI